MKLTTSFRKKFRVGNKVKKVAKPGRFRLSISRSSKNITAQIIDDSKNITLLSASSIEKEIKNGPKVNKTELSKLVAEKFLTAGTLGILALGIIAFGIGTAAGVIMAKIMNLFVKDKINPLIGAAGVSAVPMAARVANKVGLQYNSQNFLLMHAMGPNVAGVIGSAVAAGIMIKLLA